MVGVSRRDLGAISRWIGALDLRVRAMVGLLLVAGLGLAVWAVLNGQAEARLLSADPDTLPAQPSLMHFAAQRGKGVFKSHCASCHGQGGQGHYTLGIANLADADWLYGEGDVSDIETVVLYGIRAQNSRTWKLADMPAFARPIPYPREPLIKPLTPDDIRDVIQFLRVAQGQSADADAAGRGAKIFATRGGCYDCHSHDARGDPAIGAPNLADPIWLFGDGSTKWIYDSIAYGRAAACPSWVNRLSPGEILEASVYVYTLSHGRNSSKPSLP